MNRIALPKSEVWLSDKTSSPIPLKRPHQEGWGVWFSYSWSTPSGTSSQIGGLWSANLAALPTMSMWCWRVVSTTIAPQHPEPDSSFPPETVRSSVLRGVSTGCVWTNIKHLKIKYPGYCQNKRSSIWSDPFQKAMKTKSQKTAWYYHFVVM